MEQTQAHPRRGKIRRRLAETYSGLAIFALCLGIGVLMLVLGPHPYIPAWMWFALFLTSLAAVFTAGSGALPRRWTWISYGVSLVTAWAAMLTVPQQGMFVVVLVVIAAVGSYIVPLRAVAAVVVLNCTVILVHLIALGADLAEAVAVTIFYLIIHSASVLSTYALSRETRMRAELEEKNLALAAASMLVEDSAKTAERLRISRELHDLIGHQLTVLNLELEAAKHRGSGGAQEHIHRAGLVAKELLADVRTTVGELREAESADLRGHLEQLAAAVPSVEIHVGVDDDVVADEEQTAALVRAAQEIITNTVKHSQAGELLVTLTQHGGQLRLRCVNDGDTPHRITEGHGLTGLRERIGLLGGTMEVTPSPEFTVEVHLPVRERVR